MSYPDCQYSHVTWIRKDSAAFKTLIEGLKNERTAGAAVTTFLATLTSAHEAFKQGLRPGVDMNRLLATYQNTTGIISTREYTLPDIPDDPNYPGSSFTTDLIEGIAGAAMTEIGIGISLYTLVMDLVALFNIKLHLRGLLFNNSAADLEELQIYYGPNGMPNLFPLKTTLPGIKPIMNPLDKKNYDCVGFTLFGGIGFQSLEGFFVAVQAQRKNGPRPPPMYCQYYAQVRGISIGQDDRSHGPLREAFYVDNTIGVLVNQPMSTYGITAIVYG